jgi:hypothetical protein
LERTVKYFLDSVFPFGGLEAPPIGEREICLLGGDKLLDHRKLLKLPNGKESIRVRTPTIHHRAYLTFTTPSLPLTTYHLDTLIQKTENAIWARRDIWTATFSFGSDRAVAQASRTCVPMRTLEGITMVSLEQAVAAPLAMRQLADHGVVDERGRRAA